MVILIHRSRREEDQQTSRLESWWDQWKIAVAVNGLAVIESAAVESGEMEGETS